MGAVSTGTDYCRHLAQKMAGPGRELLVRPVAEYHHANESIHMHQDVGSREPCSYCWLRAGRALQILGEKALVRAFVGVRPEILVLCGSTRFYEEFRRQNLALTLEGKIVLSIGCDTKSDDDLAGVGDVEEVKAALDELHRRKIDLADSVLVLNVGGYIGESTRAEIEYAQLLGKPIRYLEAEQT